MENEEKKPEELQEAEMEQVNGGFMPPVDFHRSPGSPSSPTSPPTVNDVSKY